MLTGPKSSPLTDIQRQSIDYCPHAGHFEQAIEMHVKHLLAVVTFSAEILNISFFQLCFRDLTFSEKCPKVQEFKTLQ